MVGALREVLPWLLAYLFLLGGAITVAVVLLAGSDGFPPVTTLIIAAAMVGATTGASALHSARRFR